MSIEEDLRRRLRHFGLEKAYDASVVCSAADEVAGGRFKAISFKGGVLKIAVKNVARASRLRLEEKTIIEQVEKLSNARISRLIFTIGEDPCIQNK